MTSLGYLESEGENEVYDLVRNTCIGEVTHYKTSLKVLLRHESLTTKSCHLLHCFYIKPCKVTVKVVVEMRLFLHGQTSFLCVTNV